MTHELHPLCTLFPRVTGAEFDALVADIKANGLQNPIVLHDGMVLDGGNRYRACLQAGIDPKVRQYEGDNIVAFVLSANLHRRHLSAGQHAAIVASAQNWAAAHPAHRAGKEGCNVAPLSTVADRAAQSGVSRRTQQMADKVAKADPALAVQVGHGTVTLPQAVEKVDPKPRREPSGAEPDQEQELAEARHTIGELAQEVEQLQDRLAVENMDASEDAKTEAAQTIDGLRARVKDLERELDAMRLSRDSFQRENAELKKQITSITRQLKKAEA